MSSRKRKRKSGKEAALLKLAASLDVGSELGRTLSILPHLTGVVLVGSTASVEFNTETWAPSQTRKYDGMAVVAAALLPDGELVVCARREGGGGHCLVAADGRQTAAIPGQAEGAQPAAMVFINESTVAIGWSDGSFCACSLGRDRAFLRSLWHRPNHGSQQVARRGNVRVVPALGQVGDRLLAFTYSTRATTVCRCAIFSVSSIEAQLADKGNKSLDSLGACDLSSSGVSSTTLPVPLAVALALAPPGSAGVDKEREQEEAAQHVAAQGEAVQLRAAQLGAVQLGAAQLGVAQEEPQAALAAAVATAAPETREEANEKDAAPSRSPAGGGTRRSSRRRQRTQKTCVTCSSSSSETWHEVSSAGQSMVLLFCNDCFMSGRHLLLEDTESESRGTGKASRRRSSSRRKKAKKVMKAAGPGSEIVGKTVEITHPRRKKERGIERVLIAEFADGRHRVFSALDGQERWENLGRRKWRLADGEGECGAEEGGKGEGQGDGQVDGASGVEGLGSGSCSGSGGGAGVAPAPAAVIRAGASAGAGLKSAAIPVVETTTAPSKAEAMGRRQGRGHVVREIIFAVPQQPTEESPLPCALMSSADPPQNLLAPAKGLTLAALPGSTLVAATQATEADNVSIYLWDAREPHRSICATLAAGQGGGASAAAGQPALVALDDSGRVFVLAQGANTLCVLE